jgi:hypothetical protein
MTVPSDSDSDNSSKNVDSEISKKDMAIIIGLEEILKEIQNLNGNYSTNNTILGNLTFISKMLFWYLIGIPIIVVFALLLWAGIN